MKVMINGFGRIGRLVFRAIMEDHFQEIEIVAINDLVPADQLAYLLKYDSVHGKPSFSISHEEDYLVVRGRRVRVFCEKDPTKLPLAELLVDFAIESTGRFTEASEARKLLEAGAKKVVITAPAKGDVPTFVMGVNQGKYRPDVDHVVSNASCTTNCLAPVVKVLHDHFKVQRFQVRVWFFGPSCCEQRAFVMQVAPELMGNMRCDGCK